MIANFILKCATCEKLKKENDPWIYNYLSFDNKPGIRISCDICKTEQVIYL